MALAGLGEATVEPQSRPELGLSEKSGGCCGGTTSCSYHHRHHIVFDTAPTGHTIRLLQLPGTWTDFLAAGKGDPSCLGSLSGLEKHKQLYAKAVLSLTDPAKTRLVLVSRAQTSSLKAVERTYLELNQIGIGGGYVVVNGEYARKWSCSQHT